MDDAYLRERSEDLTDVGRHLLRSLQGIAHHDLSELPNDVVIVADDLTPSDAIRLGRERVIGFAIESGGRTSHTTIIARSLNIPAVVGLVGIMGLLQDEAPIIVDGETGTVILHPTEEVAAQYRARKAEIQRRDRDLLATRELAAVTRDGVEVCLMANIDLPEEVGEVTPFGAAGVGLYRSEFLYIEKSPRLPTEDEHVQIYRRLIELSAPHPAIIRTYDLGGRKLAREMLATQEDNPVLGLRGIRLTLARPEVFRTQIRALFRAGLYGDLWIMLPMVSTVEEVRKFRTFASEVMAEMRAGRRGLPAGRAARGHDRGPRRAPSSPTCWPARSTSSRSAPTTSSSTAWPSTATTSTSPASISPFIRRFCACYASSSTARERPGSRSACAARWRRTPGLPCCWWAWGCAGCR